MKRYFDKKLMLAPLLGVALVGFVVPSAMARMGENQPCSNCHTMHNSQDGNDVNDGDATVEGGTVANKALLIEAGCVACHTGDNSLGDGVPYVYNTAATDDLAGGNFADVLTADANGHNVFGIKGADGVLGNVAPGGVTLTSQLTCAGTTGCHGDTTEPTQFGAISGAHHGKAIAANGAMMDGSDLVNSYRMLLGVKGIEDYDWEITSSATDHNQYYGVDRLNEDSATAGTISALCASCHGTFHADVAGTDGDATEAMGNPWIRHPTDFDMNNVKTKEYGGYGGATNAYVPGVPVASDTLTAVLSTVLQANGDAIVTCVSCHRVHGSPNADMLRWDYGGMIAHGTAAGDNTEGCFACHTTKDDI